jgi:hypothetical protein
MRDSVQTVFAGVDRLYSQLVEENQNEFGHRTPIGASERHLDFNSAAISELFRGGVFDCLGGVGANSSLRGNLKHPLCRIHLISSLYKDYYHVT